MLKVYQKYSQIFCTKILHNHLGSNGSTALFYPTAANKKNIVELLIDKNSVNIRGWKDYTALIYASCTAVFNKEMIEILLDHGADVNAQSDEGDTALHFAARNGQVELFKLLEMNGADLNIYNNKKERAVHLLFSK